MKPTSILSDLFSHYLQSLIPVPTNPQNILYPPTHHLLALFPEVLNGEHVFLTPGSQRAGDRTEERRRQTAYKLNPSFHNNMGKTMSQVANKPRYPANVPRGTNATLASLDVVLMSSCVWEITPVSNDNAIPIAWCHLGQLNQHFSFCIIVAAEAFKYMKYDVYFLVRMLSFGGSVAVTIYFYPDLDRSMTKYSNQSI